MKSNKAYIFLVLALSLIYFNTTNMQFWIADYLVNIHNASYEAVVYMFTIVAITGPVFGALLSGYVGAKIGGYQSMYALPLCIFFGFFIFAAAVLIPIMSNVYIIFGLLWLMFFLGGLVVPIVTGVMLGVVEPEIRPQANSLANTSYNALGYFPAPFIYGLICEYTGGQKSQWGMIVSLYVLGPGIFFIVLALYYKPDLREFWQEKHKTMMEEYKQRQADRLRENEEKKKDPPTGLNESLLTGYNNRAGSVQDASELHRFFVDDRSMS